jgi:NCAIR mutase (PurE)-related protein
VSRGVTVNIDNGFGAAVAALKIIGATAPERATPSR